MTDVLDSLVAALGTRPTAESALRLGTCGGASGNQVLVKFDGEDMNSERTYPRLASYVVASGDRLLLARAGTTWVVLGEVLA